MPQMLVRLVDNLLPLSCCPFLKIAITLISIFAKLLELGYCLLIIEKYCGGLELVERHTYSETMAGCCRALVL